MGSLNFLSLTLVDSMFNMIVLSRYYNFSLSVSWFFRVFSIDSIINTLKVLIVFYAVALLRKSFQTPIHIRWFDRRNKKKPLSLSNDLSVITVFFHFIHTNARNANVKSVTPCSSVFFVVSVEFRTPFCSASSLRYLQQSRLLLCYESDFHTLFYHPFVLFI